ncbi:Phage terminase, large subunit [Frigoriglobus tundricola]|uniref:Phage terminase, large subunit n=1 Tax=Frigoriglobus tundricola TaxID=2774151 RepID=A0A6M5YKU4_9BACT|nr:Phage terminase, large subunit [Frigoriglobus tundricola]
MGEGRIPACKWVRLACQRHLNDLATGHERGLWWDQFAADHAIEFFGFLRHSKGKWNDEPFVLSPWQAFIVGSLFGWKRADGLRRFRIAFVEVPRKNGKTTLAAGIALYLFVCDGEAGAEIFSAATKKDQAKLVFEDAKAFVSRSPELASIIEHWKHSLQIPAARSKFEALGADADSLDGLNPFVAICDEIHAWRSRDLWDVLLTGMGAREQPLALPITTAGDFSDSIYNELHTDVEQVLEGVVSDDQIFGYIATTDAEDDWRDPAAWAKANPNLGVSLREDELRDVIKRAERQPSSQNKTKRNRLNIRTAALNAWLRLDLWDRGSAPFDDAELLGRECYAGLDLANTKDLAALVLAFPWGMEKSEPVYRLKCWFWCPADSEEAAGEKLRRKLFPWVQAGHVELTDGNTIDHGRIEAVAIEASHKYQLKGLNYDPWNAGATAQALERAGITVAKFVQNANNYNEPANALERGVLAGRVFHNGNPVLRWMVSNCVARTNGAGYIMPDRKKSRDKIDGIPASIMAIAGEMRARFEGDGESVYETRGVD